MRLPDLREFKWSPTLRLTAWYLGLIMVISLAFSIVQYRVTSNAIGAGLRRQANVFEQLPGFFGNNQDVYNSREHEITAAQRRLATSLILINLGILAGAGLASYFLAKRTLRPIEEALEMQGRFASDASHELRTPLTAMKSEIEVALRDKTISSSEARQLLVSNLEEVAKLERLTNGLLKLARHDVALPNTAVKLDEVAKEAVDRLTRLAADRQVKLELDAKPIQVTGDATSLVELVVTLVENAIKYSPSGSTVRLTTSEANRVASLAVADVGLGIRASDLPHIFDRFYRADLSRTKDDIDGYGLGLSIAKQIADLHHGAIAVRSTPGRGSTFTLQLPVRRIPSVA